MKKRLLSLCLTAALCLTLLPTAAWAEEANPPDGQVVEASSSNDTEKQDAAAEADEPEDTAPAMQESPAPTAAQSAENVAEVTSGGTTTQYADIGAAFAAAQDGDTIKLLADYKTAGEEEESGLTITKSVTLDLNGYEMDDFRVAQVNDAAETLPSGNLTVEDTSAEKTGKVTGMIELVAGKLTINGGTIGNDRDGVRIETGNLTVNGGTIDFLYSGAGSGTVTINGGTVKNARFGEGFNITVTGGSGHTGLWDVSEGTWNISGGEFENVIFKTESPAENAPISGGTFGKITRKNLQNNTETLAPISGLLADGYAFYQKTDSEEYERCVKLTDAITSLENVQVKGHTHSFVNGVCAVCDYACPHTNMNGNGFCPDCNTQMVAKVEVGDTVTYSANFKEAMNNAEDGTTVTLLANIEWGITPQSRAAITGDGKIVTLNLNGHTITGGWFDIGSDKNPTSCTLKIIGEGSHRSLEGGGYSGVCPKATLDLSEWEGGTISTINISDSSKYDETTREAAVIVGPKAGTIGKLTFGNNQLGELKKTKLSGGSFNEIWAANHQPVKLGELLAEGYAYQNADGSYEQYTKTLQNASIYNVKVVKCLHPNMKPDATGVATCEYCGKSGKFVASVDGNLYTDMKEAISYWLANGGTLKLYADYTATDGGTWRIDSGSHTVNLNGHRMSVQNDGAFKPTNNMHLTVTDGTERGQIENILLDGDQGGSFTLENGYVGNLEMTGGAVVALKGGSVDNLDVQNCSANTNLSIQGGSLGKLNIKDWADGMHVSATSGSLGAYNLPSGKILADVLDHQYYAEGTSLDKQADAAAQSWEKFVIQQAPYDFGSTSKEAEVPINGSIPFRVDSPSENVGLYDVKWYRRTNHGAVHMTENKVAGVNVGDTLDVFCVITGLDQPNNGTVLWQVAVKGYTLKTLPPSLENAEIKFADGGQKRTFWPDPDNHSVGKIEIRSGLGLYTVTLGGKTLAEGTDYQVISGNVATGIGTYDLTIEGIAPNYSGTKTAQWTVVPYPLGAYKISPSNKQYDGTAALPDGAFPGRFDPMSPYLSDITLREGTDYIVTDARFDTPDASNENKPYRYTVELKNPNYVFANGTKVQTWVYGVDVNATIEITKADAPAAREGALEVINNHADTYTVDLSALLPPLESPRTYGEIEYSQPTVQLASGYYTDGHAKVENGKLILTIDKNPVTTTGPIGTVTVQVTSTNYEDVTLTVNLNAVNKQRLGMFVSVATDPIVYGMTLGDIKLSAEATVDKQVIPGTIAWDDPLTTLPAAGQATYRWTFTPDDTMHYLTASNTINFLVDKATPTGAPTYTAITTGGKTLADAPLKPNTSWPGGTVQWVDKDGKPLPASTQVQANTEYTWRFTPADTANYNGATGSVTLYAVTSGGGSSSGGGGGGGGSSSASKTTTTTNADGSVTKTETKADGTVIAATTAKDGSVTRIETKPDGSSVTQRTLADGSTGTVKTAADGTTRVEASISAQAVEGAKKSGSAVQVPTQVRAGQRSDSAPTVRIELPKNAGETKLEIPVENVNSGTVAVIVHEDGTEELVTDSLPTETGVQLTVDGSATVKLLQNAKSFADTKDHWAKDAIDFVSARGLVSGMGGTTYAPDASTTRAQLWTILARQSGADLTGGATWYEKAQAWSKASGVSDGSNPNAAISRAQVVTMLWRAAGSPAAQSGTAFHDVAADSYYGDAVDWAVAHGITSGVGSGRFDPNGTCTRAQLAAFLMRSYQNQ